MMLAGLLLNVVGYERVSDVDAPEVDSSLCRLVRDYEPSLLGVLAGTLSKRFRGGQGCACPSANTVHNWMARFQNKAAGTASN